ncbi:unnamed protein product [Rotaria sordida]|uniref:Uncharacterized protein n=1 Tax=Rotaria sordida TaxID=392033 RepID=A0A815UG30_9BILA|nr:unnamed protein product [Rotaria sordida]CAF1661313.1 unnamed protein product [Rotaria sordida]CAF3699156.1 unnamed protein product [Rotaria sordida]CAF3828575.1 unnamed protein product [Rotaria sordida]
MAARRRWKSDTHVDKKQNDFDASMLIDLNKLEQKEEQDFGFKTKINLEDIGALFEMIKNESSQRSLSVLIYLALTYFGISWRTIDDFLQQIGGTTCRTAHKWAETFIDGDLDEFNEECRGGKRFDSFFDIFPELENQMKLFAIQGCQRKDASFTSLEMAQYLDQQYYKLTGQVKTSDQLVRSERVCRLDLRRYGFTFDKNTQRPYWSGHERPDVVENRKEFVQAFLENKQNYYLVTDGINPQWIFPKQDPVILLCE